MQLEQLSCAKPILMPSNHLSATFPHSNNLLIPVPSLPPSLHLSLSCLVPLNTFFLPYVSASSAFSPETLFDPQLIPHYFPIFEFFYIFLFLHSSYFISIYATLATLTQSVYDWQTNRCDTQIFLQDCTN